MRTHYLWFAAITAALSAPVLAQADRSATAQPLFPGQIRPVDVPAYVPQPILYPVGNEPAATPPATVPLLSNPPLPDYPTPNRSQWLETGTYNLCATVAQGGTCAEEKFRTGAEFNVVAHIDPIRNFGYFDKAHWHTFYGNRAPTPTSTYATLRHDADGPTGNRRRDGSDAAGGNLNMTSYWQPSVMSQTAAGQKFAIVPNDTIIYYLKTMHPVRNTPRGMRYVWGRNPETPNQTLNIVAAANARHQANGGTGNRYAASTFGSQDGVNWHTWLCVGATPERVTHLVNSDGTDPFNGTCNPGQYFALEASGSACSDGVNLWSPTGFDHFIRAIYDLQAGKWVCPNNWLSHGVFQVGQEWPNFGFAARPDGMGRSQWSFSSDAMSRNVNGTMGVRKGESFHSDWLDGWDWTARTTWEKFGLGVGNTNERGFELGDSQISGTEKLIAGSPSPDGKNPQVNFDGPYRAVPVPDLNPNMVHSSPRSQ